MSEEFKFFGLCSVNEGAVMSYAGAGDFLKETGNGHVRLHPAAYRTLEIILVGVEHRDRRNEHREAVGSAEYIRKHRLTGHISAVSYDRLVGVAEDERYLLKLRLSGTESAVVFAHMAYAKAFASPVRTEDFNKCRGIKALYQSSGKRGGEHIALAGRSRFRAPSPCTLP